MPTTDEIEWKDCWKKPVKVQYKEITETAVIETREGKLYGYAGIDVLLKGIKGEVYPCKIDIFNATYTTTAPLSEEEIRANERAKFNLEDLLNVEMIKTDAVKEYIKSSETVKKIKQAERQRCIREVMIVIIDLQEKIRYSKDSDFCCPEAKAHEFNGLVKAAKVIAKLSEKVE